MEVKSRSTSVIKLLQACHGILEVPSTVDSMRAILEGARSAPGVNITFTPYEVTPQERSELAAAVHALLDANQVSQLLGGELQLHPNVGPRPPPPPPSSAPQSPAASPPGKQAKGGPVAQLKNFVKFSCRCIDSFPALRELDELDVRAVERFIDFLVTADCQAAAAQVLVSFAPRLQPAARERVIVALLRAREFGALVSALEALKSQTRPASQTLSPRQSGPPSPFGALSAAQAASLMLDVHTRLCELDDPMALAEAVRLAKAYGSTALAQKALSLVRINRMDKYVRQGKWQVAVHHARSTEEQARVYSRLRDTGMIGEAEEVWMLWQLDRLGLSPISDAEVSPLLPNMLASYSRCASCFPFPIAVFFALRLFTRVPTSFPYFTFFLSLCICSVLQRRQRGSVLCNVRLRQRRSWWWTPGPLLTKPQGCWAPLSRRSSLQGRWNQGVRCVQYKILSLWA
jgi:hypothetical protein